MDDIYIEVAYAQGQVATDLISLDSDVEEIEDTFLVCRFT